MRAEHLKDGGLGGVEFIKEVDAGKLPQVAFQLLAGALQEQRIVLDVALELPGFLGLPAIVGTTDLIATLPRHIGETLAHYYGLSVLDCPLAIAGFTVKQYWHARFLHDPASQWLRGVCAELFQQQEVRGLHRSGRPKIRRPRGLPS